MSYEDLKQEQKNRVSKDSYDFLMSYFVLNGIREHEKNVSDFLQAMLDDSCSECIAEISSGCYIVSPAPPFDTDYVRIVSPKGYELVRWTWCEWEEQPKRVMGQIMSMLQNLPVFDIKEIERKIEEAHTNRGEPR